MHSLPAHAKLLVASLSGASSASRQHIQVDANRNDPSACYDCLPMGEPLSDSYLNFSYSSPYDAPLAIRLCVPFCCNSDLAVVAKHYLGLEQQSHENNTCDSHKHASYTSSGIVTFIIC